MRVGYTAEPSVVAPMLDVLGDESSGSEGEDVGGGGASPPKDVKVGSMDRRACYGCFGSV